jgi:hypothetical protein
MMEKAVSDGSILLSMRRPDGKKKEPLKNGSFYPKKIVTKLK